ncbi:DddA-like double-stranded DNA deaminase toxin [Prauserella halophila]
MPWPVATSADVEMKLAAHMADNNITEVTVVINNRPCQGALSCDNLVSVLLPAGSSLTVHGTEPDGTPFMQTYRGGRKPPWQ